MKNILPVLLFLIIGFSTNAVFAQDEALMKGTETPGFKTKTDTTRCLVFNQYVVKTVSGEDVGENISVYKRAASTNANAGCKAKNALLFSIKNPDANYFIGLAGNYLFIDSGTGADVRGLEIYNLTTRKSMFSSDYHDSVKLLQDRFVMFDKISAKKGLIKSCKQAAEIKRNGSIPGWVQDTKLDLQTMKTTSIGALRCYAME